MRDEATIVQKSIRAVAPGAIRTRRRRANIGSSTAPVVPESGRPPITAPGARMLPPRPRNRARSVSNSRLPDASPSTTARCAAQTSGSVGARRRLVASMAPRPARCSVSMNSFENAGCATSAAWDARTSST